MPVYSRSVRRSLWLLAVLLALASCSEAVITPIRDDLLFRRQRFPDIVFANDSTVDFVHLGDFDGFLAPRAVDATVTVSLAVAAGDTDGDGLDDILVGTQGAPSEHRLYRNTGDATFALESNPGATVSTAALIADVEDDGDLDYIIGGGTSIFVYLNPGDGRLVGGTNINLGGSFAFTSVFAFVLSDMSGNGFPDVLFIGQESTGPTEGAFIARNNASGVSPGTFEPPELAFSTGFLEDIAALDFNSDGIQDFLIARGGDPVNLIQGTGGGAFTTATTSIEIPPDPAMSEKAVAAGDVNNDGHTDLVFGTDTVNRVYLGNGVDGTFTGSDIGTESAATSDIVLHDLNLDGNLDVVVANNGTTNVIHYGNGDGSFGAAIALDTRTDGTTAAAVGVFQ